MTRTSLIAAALALTLGAGLTGGLLTAATRWAVTEPIAGPIGEDSRTARTRGWFTPRGFHPPEVDLEAGRQFSWTSTRAELRVASIDRRRAYRIAFTIRAGRGPDSELPQLVVSIDGAPTLRTALTNEPQIVTVVAPSTDGTSLSVRITPSNTFAPGPTDRRTLGVVVDDVAIEPVDAPFQPTWRTLLLAGLATALYVLAALAVGFGAAAAGSVGVVVSFAHVWLLLQDGAFLGVYVDRLLRVALGAASMGGLIGIARRLRPGAGVREWAYASGLVVLASALKLSVLWHPRTPVGDGIFHVHRAELVERGTYFFTSITPRPFYEFPYAIALYVNAMPVWDWFRDDAGHLLLLRGIALIADAIVGLAMYGALTRAWPDRRIGLAFAALWPFAHISMQTLCTANLTNVYGQGLFSAGLAVILWLAAAGSTSIPGLCAAAALLTAGFLSHFSTLAVGVPLVAAVAVMLLLLGRGPSRRLGTAVIVVLAAALAIAYAVYYSHFHEVYRTTFARLMSGEGADETRSLAAPVRVKASRWIEETWLNFGVPLAAAALAGAAWIVGSDRRSPAAIVLAAWAATWVVFSALGVFSAVEMRANLAAAPLAFALGAFAIGSAAQAAPYGRALAIAAAIAIGSTGAMEWALCLTGRP